MTNRRPKAVAGSRAAPKAITVHRAVPEGSGYGGHFSVCVRLCDGYVFPIGNYNGERDRPAQEATCRATCPGAATALYTVNGDMDAIGGAVRAGTNATYANLPTAFKYTKAVDTACSCHPPGKARIASILHDYTLRRGDAVMTNVGFKIFRGGSYPYKPKDFSPLLASRDIPKEHRAILEVMERVTRKRATSNENGPALTVLPKKPASPFKPIPITSAAAGN